MKPTLGTLGLSLLLAATAWGQRSAGPSGFGRILFPGGDGPTSGGLTSTSGRIMFPGTGTPAPRGTGIGAILVNPNPPRIDHQQHTSGPRGIQTIAPYPVFYGGGYYNYNPPPAQFINYNAPGYGSLQPSQYAPSSYQPGSFDAQRNGDPSASSPVVIINQYFQRGAEPPVTETVTPNGAVEVEPQPAEPPADNGNASVRAEPTVFLIALEDHTIFAATAYWIEDDTLNYITTDGAENQVSLALVDRALSRQLNRERNVAFGMPEN